MSFQKKRSPSGFGFARFGVVQDAGVDLVAYKPRDEFTDFGIVEEADHLLAVSVHAPNDELFQLAVENVGEVVDGVGLACIADGFVRSGVGSDLVLGACRK